MRAYLIRRLILIIPTLFMVTLIVFFTARFIPGDVIEMMVSEMAAEGAVANIELTSQYIRERLGLDVPVHVQYGRWLGVLPYPDTGDERAVSGFNGILEGNLGVSLWTGRSIAEEIGNRVQISMELGLLAILIGLTIALPLGVYSAIRQDTAADYIGRTIAIIFISVPSFWIGTMLMVYPSIWWGWMPPIEYIPFGSNPLGNLQQFIIPAVIMGMVSSGTEMRMTRTMMLEVMRQDYIRTAWSKGLGERTVILRHALKNALIPVITITGLQVPILIGGTVVMETIFSLPGMGRYLVEALNKRDYPIISGVNLAIGTMVLFVNLVVDLAYGWLDPRVQFK